VQFAKRCQDGVEHAIKFYLSRTAFDRELGLYQDVHLREILVPLVQFDENDTRVVRSSSGYVFPPFIVVERGEVWVP
jgi:hypothetical protein